MLFEGIKVKVVPVLNQVPYCDGIFCVSCHENLLGSGMNSGGGGSL